MLVASLDDMSEDEARARLVPSNTTLLGLVKHAAFVERVWFEEAFDALPREASGIPEAPDESFELATNDTIASIREEFELRRRASDGRLNGLGLDHVLTGNRRGTLPLRWVLMHVLREYAQHCGHADILREQLLSRRRQRAH